MIGLYRGKSLWPSRIIELITWSEYSHASWIQNVGTKTPILTGEYEAWMDGGVVYNEHWGDRHTAGTVVDLYDFVKPLTVEETRLLEEFLKKQLCKAYDWTGVFGFLWLVRLCGGGHHNLLKWFCFELIAAACRDIGRALSNLEPWQMSGKDFKGSLQIHYVGSVVVPDRAVNKIDTSKMPIKFA